MATATATKAATGEQTRALPESHAADVQRVYRLPTQEKRAAFVRKEIRRLKWSIEDLASMADVAWATAANYAWLSKTHTKDPRTDTTRKVFGALGYSIAFVAKEAKGIIEL